MSGEKRCGCAVCEFAEYTEAILGGARGGGKTNTLRAEVEAGRSVATDSTEHDHEASLSPAARDFAKQADVAPAATLAMGMLHGGIGRGGLRRRQRRSEGGVGGDVPRERDMPEVRRR